MLVLSSPLPAALASLVLSFVSLDVRATPIAGPVTGLSVPMTRRTNAQRFTNLEELGSWARRNKERTEAKYGRRQVEKRSSGVNLLTNLAADSTYFGSLAIGTPPTAFDVILDTGSSDLWLATGSSRSTSRTSKGIALYEPDSSSTFNDIGKTFSIQYGSGSAEGVLGSDLVQFAGFQVNQTFGLVNETSNQLLTAPLSGLMGMAFQSIAASGATPFWQSLAETTGALDSPLFAFQLTRYTNDTSTSQLEPGGTFTLGAVNNSLFTGDIDYQNIPDGAPGYWVQELTSLTVNGQTISLPTGSNAWTAIDTGTTGIGCPQSILQSIFSAIPGSAPGTGDWSGYYTYPCSTNVNVNVKWGSSSNTWSISTADFLLQQLTQDTCVGAFFAVDASGTQTPPFIFGDSFLKNVYSVFRSSPASVGFATLSSEALSMNGADGPVPSPTIGAVTSVSPTSTGGTNGSPSSSAAAPSMHISSMVVLLSALAGALIIL